jgi:hypothetical protein
MSKAVAPIANCLNDKDAYDKAIDALVSIAENAATVLDTDIRVLMYMLKNRDILDIAILTLNRVLIQTDSNPVEEKLINTLKDDQRRNVAIFCIQALIKKDSVNKRYCKAKTI